MLILEERWVVLEDIPYVRAIHSIPKPMRAKLPIRYINSLDLTVGAAYLLSVH